jgi:hypothetical protein
LVDWLPRIVRWDQDGIQLGVALGQHACAVTETRAELFKRRLLRQSRSQAAEEGASCTRSQATQEGVACSSSGQCSTVRGILDLAPLRGFA